MSENIIEEENIEDTIFEELEELISKEERLILRLQSFCEESIIFEDDCTEEEDREAKILEKASKIASKLFNNVLEHTQYKLKDYKIIAVKSKIRFKISKEDSDEDTQVFVLTVENDGFELEQV
jgi:hypothetical protein